MSISRNSFLIFKFYTHYKGGSIGHRYNSLMFQWLNCSVDRARSQHTDTKIVRYMLYNHTNTTNVSNIYVHAFKKIQITNIAVRNHFAWKSRLNKGQKGPIYRYLYSILRPILKSNSNN